MNDNLEPVFMTRMDLIGASGHRSGGRDTKNIDELVGVTVKGRTRFIIVAAGGRIEIYGEWS